MKKSINYTEVKRKNESTIKTNILILDDFLSRDGGFVRGSAIYLTGTSGGGKTTFSVMLQKILENNKTSFYSREMDSASVYSQMGNFRADHKNAYISDKESCANLDEYIEELEELKPDVVIIDSLQFIMKEDYANMPYESTCFDIIQKLRMWATKNNSLLIVIGHVNKDGSFEGKNTIEHMFDAHLRMIYDKKDNSRVLSWEKNRKGDVNKTLYYEFGDGILNFYSEQEYSKIKNNKDIEDYIIEAVKNYAYSFGKNTEKFKKIKNYLKQNKNRIDDKEGVDVGIEFARVINEATNMFVEDPASLDDNEL